ncbi:site-specific integrase [bacterium]|nr:site-specific integrase [bacterium]
MSKQTGKAKNTLVSLDQSFRLRFNPFFGKLLLPNIRPHHVEDFQQERAKEGEFSTVNLELGQLKTVLNAAIRWGYLGENPAKGVKPLRLPEKEPPYLTRDQIASLYPACRGWLFPFVALALNTGLRISELLALKWEDVDLKGRVIKVRSDEEFTTKGRRNREIPINDFLLGVLRKHPRHITCPHVVYTRQGVPPVQSQARARFATALRRAGLPHLRIHDMRHTFGTTLAESGVDVVTIQRLMGHRDIKTTMVYLHAAPNRMQWAVEHLRLDGSTQAEADAAEGGNLGRHGQDLVTDAHAGETASG